MTIQRGKSSPVSNSGSYKGGTNSEPESALPGATSATAPGPSSYEEFVNDVRPEDTARAEESILLDISNEWDNRWDAVMGAKTKRTAANNAKYAAHIRALYDAHPRVPGNVERLAKHFAEMSAHERAFEAGVPTQFDKYFDRMWAGTTTGFSELATLSDLAETQTLKANFEAGRVQPRFIVGTGYRDSRKVAAEYLDNYIARLERRLRTKGRSDSVNGSNARGSERRAQAARQ